MINTEVFRNRVHGTRRARISTASAAIRRHTGTGVDQTRSTSTMVERGLIEGRYERARANAAAAVVGPLADVHKWTPAEVETDMLERLETVMPREEALEEANAVAEKLYAIDELRNGDVFRGAARIHAATTGKPFDRKTTARLLDAEKQLHEINDENRILYQKARDAQDAALVNGGNDVPEDGPPFNTFASIESNEVNPGVAWFRQFVIPALERLQL